MKSHKIIQKESTNGPLYSMEEVISSSEGQSSPQLLGTDLTKSEILELGKTKLLEMNDLIYALDEMAKNQNNVAKFGWAGGLCYLADERALN